MARAGDLFGDIAHLLVGYTVGALGMRNQVVERDFGWVGHGPLPLWIDGHQRGLLILFMLRPAGSQPARFSVALF
jgi:hypothetical protein